MWQSRMTRFARSVASTPTVPVAGPAASPPSRKPLQSMVTLLAVTLIAWPLESEVVWSACRHHVPEAEMTAGSDEIVPVQLSKLLAASTGAGADASARHAATENGKARVRLRVMGKAPWSGAAAQFLPTLSRR